MTRLYRRLALFLSLLGRESPAGGRFGPRRAWSIAKCFWLLPFASCLLPSSVACDRPLTTSAIDAHIAQTGRFPTGLEQIMARCYRDLAVGWEPAQGNYRAVLGDEKLAALSRREGGPPPMWVALTWIVITPGILNSPQLLLTDPYGAGVLAHEFYHVHQAHRDGTGPMLWQYAGGLVAGAGVWHHDIIQFEQEAIAFERRARAWFTTHRKELESALADR